MSEERKFKVILLSERLDEPGPGTYTADLARSLDELGHEVFLIAMELPDEKVLSGFELPVRLCRHLAAWGLGGIMRKWLVRELRVFGPELLHAAVPRLGSVGRQIASKLHVPSVVTVHGGGLGEKEWGPADLRGAAVIAASQSVREDLVNHLRIPKAQISVIYPGVKVRPGQVPQSKGDGRTTVVGTLGSREHLEGHQYLLRAVRLILDRGLDLQVLIAGTGPERSSLRELVDELGLNDAVTFVGDMAHPRRLIEVMDIFVLPTTREGMSPVVLEAMALGKPVVVSGTGGIFAAVRQGHTGLVFPKGDVDALAAAVRRLMLKPDFTARIAREGRELVRREFSLDEMVKKTLQLYAQLTGTGASSEGPLATRTP